IRARTRRTRPRRTTRSASAVRPPSRWRGGRWRGWRRRTRARRLQGNFEGLDLCVLGHERPALELFPGGGFLDESASLERLPPAAVRRVPGDGLREPVVEAPRRLPAELRRDLRRVQQVPTVVSRP